MPVRILPSKVIQRLAAGEVIDRPSSVVKELLDNSLDAGARDIRVLVRGGGITRIVVEDDGAGMSVDDLRLCLLPHATSKLPDDARLDVVSRGFRGEALASMATVAEVSVTSRHCESDMGWMIVSRQGDLTPARPASLPKGTRVDVSGLFKLIPARLKFLKSERSELSRVRQVVIQSALAHPHVSYTLQSNDRVLLRVAGSNCPEEERERLHTLIDPQFATEAVRVQGTVGNISIDGWLRINERKAGSSLQVRQQIVVNGLAVKAPQLTGTIRHTIKREMGSREGGDFIIRVQLPPERIDMNVHPRKEEIHFAEEEELRRCLADVIARSLKASGFGAGLQVKEAVQRAAKEHDGEQLASQPLGRPLGQAHGSWLVCETSSGIAVIDQHAAHERILLERMRRHMDAQDLEVRRLPVPRICSISYEEKVVLLDCQDLLTEVGIDLHDVGGTSVSVNTLPAILTLDSGLETLLQELAQALSDAGGRAAGDLLLRVITKASCRAAIKAGDSLSGEEMEGLVRQMEKTPNADRCIHGRPSIVFLSNDDLKHLFERC